MTRSVMLEGEAMNRCQEETKQIKHEAKHAESGHEREMARRLIIQSMIAPDPEPKRRLSFFEALANFRR